MTYTSEQNKLFKPRLSTTLELFWRDKVMLAELPGSTTGLLFLVGGLAVVAGALAVSRSRWKRKHEQALEQANWAYELAQDYLRRLILFRLRPHPLDRHYLTRLVEDLGIDQRHLEPALQRLEQYDLLTSMFDRQRGTFFKLTQAGLDWEPTPGRLEESRP